MSGKWLYGVAGALLLLLVLALVWLLSHGGLTRMTAPHMSGTNPALNVRYRYDSSQLKPGPYVSNAEFPLQLNGDGWSFYAKRLGGLGDLVAKTGPMLYDFVGSQQNDVFEDWYKLALEGKPTYEDARLQGQLGLHTMSIYDRTPESPGWPAYFPAAVTGTAASEPAADIPPKAGKAPVLDPQTQNQIMRDISKNGGVNKAYVESWAMFTKHDLFYFYAISAAPLTRVQRQAALDVINSMQFDAVLGATAPAAQGSVLQQVPPAQKPGAASPH